MRSMSPAAPPARIVSAAAGAETAVDAAGDAAVMPRERDPERSRAAILAAATGAFAAHGLGGARVDAIAVRAGVNKRMLYHYYGNKEDLYLAVLETTYAAIREPEAALDLAHLEPEAGIRELVRFTFDYFQKPPEFLILLNTENMLEARHLRRSRRIHDLHRTLVANLADLIVGGERSGRFRAGVDPVQRYITIAALGFFYLSNRHTLSTIFGRTLDSRDALEARAAHIVDVVLGYLRPDPPR
jgi:AcrR family transcriptional regulator